MTYTDRSLTCVQCGNDFTFTAEEIATLNAAAPLIERLSELV